MVNHRIRVLLPALAAALAAALLTAGCATAPAPADTGAEQTVWQKGSDPARDAPRWTRGGKAALREARVRGAEVPKKYLVYVGVSEDRPDERGARFSAIEDLFKRYAVFLQQELDQVLPQAAARAKLTLPALNTALGADRSLGFLSREEAQRDLIRASWQATGTQADGAAVVRIYMLGVIDRDARRAHLLEAAKETFKYAMIRRDDQERILQEAEKLIRKL